MNESTRQIPNGGLKSNRRQFLAAVASGGAALARPRFGAGADRRLRVGVIGCGWYGMVDMNAAWKAGGVEAVALCDVDSDHLRASGDEAEKAQGSRPKLHKNYREMLAAGGMDAVIIATPPHWHALPFIEACQKGLAIYCEKPLAYDIREGQAMMEAARKAGNIVQIGFQRRQGDTYQEAARYIREGHAGRIVQVDAQIHYRASTPGTRPQDPPASLDWDQWCGPAPKLPYSPAIGHRTWRLEKAYGNGHLVDWGIHLIDAARNMLGEDMPKRVSATGGIYELRGKITTPDSLTAHFDFEQCPVFWRHRLWGSVEYTPEINNGLMFFGEKQSVFVTDGRWEILPGGKDQAKKTIAAKRTGNDQQVAHLTDFLEAVRAGRQPSCGVDDGARSAATVQLAMLSYEAGAPVEWDRQKWQITNNTRAAKLLKRGYRAPWRHPFAG
jgi:predicted dehydrogenase